MTNKIQIEKTAQLTGHNASIYALSSTKNTQFFLSGAGDGWIVRWDLEAPDLGKLIAKVETQIFALYYLEALEKIVVGNMNGGVHWVDIKNPEQTKNIAHHKKGVFGIKKIKEHIITIGGDGILTKWSIPKMQSLESIQLSYESLRTLDYNDALNEIAVGSSDNNIYLLDADSLALKHTISQAHDNSVFSVRYSNNGQQLLSGGRDAQLKVWQSQSPYNCLSSQAAHWFTINDIAIHPHQPIFATASRDKTIKIWDSNNFTLLKVIETIRDEGHLNSVNALIWTNNGAQLLSASDDRIINVWKVF